MRECAYCRSSLDNEWLTVGDNFLQAKYFDAEENNRFCSPECVCRALSTQRVEINEDGKEETYEFF